MVEYPCSKCGKIFKQKNDNKRHLSKKKSCVTILNKVEPVITGVVQALKDSSAEIKTPIDSDKVITGVVQALKDSSAEIKTPIDSDKVITGVVQAPKDSSVENKSNMCIFCKKIFSKNSNMHRHINISCKVKKESDKLKEELFDKLLEQKEVLENESKKKDVLLEQQKEKLEEKQNVIKKRRVEINEFKKKDKKRQKDINELQDKIKNLQQQITIYNNNTTNNNTMNNNINITIVAHGEEDLKYITEKKIKQLLGRGFKSLENLIEHVHFNKNKPEHHNIYVPSTKDSHVMCYNGKKWKLEHSEEKIRELIEDKETYLVEEYDKWKDQLKSGDKKKFDRFMSSLEDDKQNKIRRGEIKLLLYNNRDIVKDTRRKIKESKMLEDTERVTEIVEV
jgi:hypothetical protein